MQILKILYVLLSPGSWTDKEANILVQNHNCREFRVINFWTSSKAKTTVAAAGWKSQNFPDRNLECNSGDERRFSPHLSSISMWLAHGGVWPTGIRGRMGSLDVKSSLSRCRLIHLRRLWGGSQSCCGMPKVEFFPNESSPVTTWWIHVFLS